MPELRELDLSVDDQVDPAGQNDALILAAAFVASSPRISLLRGSSFIFISSLKTLLKGTSSVTSLFWKFHADPFDVGFLTFLSTSTCLPLLAQVTLEFGCAVYFFAEEDTQSDEEFDDDREIELQEEDFEGKPSFAETFADAILRLDTAPHRVGVLTRVNISFGTFDNIPLDIQRRSIADIRNKLRKRRGTGEGIELTITFDGVSYPS